MLNKLALKIGLLFFVFILVIETVLFLTLYVNYVDERVEEVMTNLLARGNTHSEVLEDSFESTTLNHVAMMESASDFIVIITDADGNELTHSDTIEPEMRDVLQHTDFGQVPQDGKIVEDRWDDKQFIATDSPITIAGEHRGHVFMFAETNHIQQMVEHLRNQFLFVGLIAAVLTIAAIFVLSRLITRPLIRMKEATEQLRQGNHTVRLNLDRKDELGELANAITTLSTDLDRLKKARNEFLASISHELRTPLTYIKGYADIAGRPDTSDDEKREYIGIIREETAHLTELIRQLFELAQLDHNEFSIRKETVSLNRLFRSVAGLVRPAFDEKHISLVVQCPPEVTALLDPERFQQVLLNVLDNARKYSPEGSLVTLLGTQENDTVFISVSDEGEGIPAADLPFVFDRLYRVDKSRSRQYGGSGLGLTIAKEIVESHGGQMTIQSENGKGTTVQMELKRGIRLQKVLLVDDEKRMLDLFALYLKPHQYLCTKALGPFEALSYLEKESYDLILLDVMMPEMDGWELCREIRKFSDVPIIMLTAREQQEDIIKGLKTGADDYVTKPFNEEELLARMEALLRRRTLKKSIEVKGLFWDEDRFELSYQNHSIKLTPKEFLMLGQLMKNPDKVFSRDQLIQVIWGFDSETEGRTIDSHVRNVREKIRQAGFPIDDHFLTVWGIGYKWINEAEV